MDMGKHPLIFQLAIKIDKETFIDLCLFILLLFESSDLENKNKPKSLYRESSIKTVSIRTDF